MIPVAVPPNLQLNQVIHCSQAMGGSPKPWSKGCFPIEDQQFLKALGYPTITVSLPSRLPQEAMAGGCFFMVQTQLRLFCGPCSRILKESVEGHICIMHTCSYVGWTQIGKDPPNKDRQGDYEEEGEWKTIKRKAPPSTCMACTFKNGYSTSGIVKDAEQVVPSMVEPLLITTKQEAVVLSWKLR